MRLSHLHYKALVRFSIRLQKTQMHQTMCKKVKRVFFIINFSKKQRLRKAVAQIHLMHQHQEYKSDATTQNKLVSNVIPVHVEKAEQLLDNKMNSELMTEYQTDDDSVNVNTSLDGSSGSEKASLNEQLDASLPLEREPVAELVRKLQLAAEAHTPQYVIQVCSTFPSI